MDPVISDEGHDMLSSFFSLSRASFLTIPRVLLEAMPDEWQGKMADLLFEYEATFPNQPDVGTTVRLTDMRGRLIPTPEWICNYRHPDREAIDRLRIHKTLKSAP